MSHSVQITVQANPDADDCFADAASQYRAQHPGLKGWDLNPTWADETRKTVTLTVPRWHWDLVNDTSGT